MMTDSELLLHMSVLLERRLMPLKHEIKNIKASMEKMEGKSGEIGAAVEKDIYINSQESETCYVAMPLAVMIEEWMRRVDGIQDELEILQNLVEEQQKEIKKMTDLCTKRDRKRHIQLNP